MVKGRDGSQLSMDDVLQSVKRTFADDQDPAADPLRRRAKARAGSLAASAALASAARSTPIPSAQASIRAQQARLVTSRSLRRKLPPIPQALREPDAAAAPASSGAQGLRSQAPHRLHAEVPAQVRVNAVAAPSSPLSVQPLYRWGKPQTPGLEAGVESGSEFGSGSGSETLAVVPGPAQAASIMAVKDHATAQSQMPRLSPQTDGTQALNHPRIQPLPRPVPTDGDWNELKADLRQALEQWGDKQRAGGESSQ